MKAQSGMLRRNGRGCFDSNGVSGDVHQCKRVLTTFSFYTRNFWTATYKREMRVVSVPP